MALKINSFFLPVMDEVRFRRPVVPGDQLIMELTLVKRKASLWKMEGKASVEGEVAAEAMLMAAIYNKSKGTV